MGSILSTSEDDYLVVYTFFNALLGLFLLFLIICAIAQQSIYNKKTRIFKESLDEALRLGIVRRIDRSEMESSHEQPRSSPQEIRHHSGYNQE